MKHTKTNTVLAISLTLILATALSLVPEANTLEKEVAYVRELIADYRPNGVAWYKGKELGDKRPQADQCRIHFDGKSRRGGITAVVSLKCLDATRDELTSAANAKTHTAGQALSLMNNGAIPTISGAHLRGEEFAPEIREVGFKFPDRPKESETLFLAPEEFKKACVYIKERMIRLAPETYLCLTEYLKDSGQIRISRKPVYRQNLEMKYYIVSIPSDEKDCSYGFDILPSQHAELMSHLESEGFVEDKDNQDDFYAHFKQS